MTWWSLYCCVAYSQFNAKYRSVWWLCYDGYYFKKATTTTTFSRIKQYHLNPKPNLKTRPEKNEKKWNENCYILCNDVYTLLWPFYALIQFLFFSHSLVLLGNVYTCSGYMENESHFTNKDSINGKIYRTFTPGI